MSMVGVDDIMGGEKENAFDGPMINIVNSKSNQLDRYGEKHDIVDIKTYLQ